jgi:hypothetical protein
MLAVSPRLTEPASTQCSLQCVGIDAPEYAGVEDVDATDPAPDRMVGKHPAEAFDIG